VIVALILQVITGLAIWKPVQFAPLVGVFGGYPVARNIHLATMLLIVAFVIVHLALVAIFPRTLVSMIVGVPAEPKTRA
jgi:thiosulfate reductase cytochrome b subunit